MFFFNLYFYLSLAIFISTHLRLSLIFVVWYTVNKGCLKSYFLITLNLDFCSFFFIFDSNFALASGVFRAAFSFSKRSSLRFCAASCLDWWRLFCSSCERSTLFLRMISADWWTMKSVCNKNDDNKVRKDKRKKQRKKWGKGKRGGEKRKNKNKIKCFHSISFFF